MTAPFYNKLFATVQSQAKFHKSDVNACISKADYGVLFGGYTTPPKCEALWRLVLNSYNYFKNAVKTHW